MLRSFTINHDDLSIDEVKKVSKYYKGLKATRDTLTEYVENDLGEKFGTTYYIFTGSWVPYGSCVKRGNKYVFARYSRYDALSEDFTDFAIDCEDTGKDSSVFDTKHISVIDGKVEY